MTGTEGAQRIGDVIPGVLQRTRQRHGALLAIQRAWGRLVGKQLVRHTRPVSLRRGRLIVHADRPGDGFALSYQRTQLLEGLRATAKKPVEDIVIRPGDVKHASC